MSRMAYKKTIYILVALISAIFTTPCYGRGAVNPVQSTFFDLLPLTYYLHDATNRYLILTIKDKNEVVISNFNQADGSHPWCFKDSYKAHYLERENAIVVDLLSRTTRTERKFGPLFPMFAETPISCQQNLLPILTGDTIYINETNTMVWFKGLFLQNPDLFHACENPSPWFHSDIDGEIFSFKQLYGFLPHRYIYTDGSKRNLSIEFVSRDTLKLTNVDCSPSDTGNLSFDDYYLIDYSSSGNEIIVKKLLSSSRRDACDCKQANPFRSSNADCSQAVFNMMTNDTLYISACPANKDKYIVAKGLLFHAAGAGVFGEWHSQGKKLKSILDEDKLKKMIDVLNGNTSIDPPIDPIYKECLKFSH